MKSLVFPLVLLASGATATTALADDPAACVDAASKAQKLRNSHQLLEARAALRICAAAGCPPVVQSDCVPWLAEVEKVLPGVVVTAKDGAGADILDVKVTVDGQPFLTKLDGQSVAIDAGPHTFHFQAPDGTTLDRQVVVREGDKGQSIAVVLGAAPVTPSSVTPEAGGSPWRTTAWVIGGVGVAGILIGAITGGIAVADKSAADCTNNICNQGTVSGIKGAAVASDVGFIAGGILTAGGLALVLFGPKGGHSTTTGVRLLPVVTAGGGEIMAGGRF
jgi:hypothetical protein